MSFTNFAKALGVLDTSNSSFEVQLNGWTEDGEEQFLDLKREHGEDITASSVNHYF